MRSPPCGMMDPKAQRVRLHEPLTALGQQAQLTTLNVEKIQGDLHGYLANWRKVPIGKAVFTLKQ